MKTISHQKAQQYLHLGQESLEAGQRQALQEHLFVCEDCRKYGRDLIELERDLRQIFHNGLDPIPTPTGIAGEVRERLGRSNRNRRAFSLAGSLVGGLVLVLILVFLVESFSGSRLPAAESTPLLEGTERAGDQAFGAEETASAPTPVTTVTVTEREQVLPVTPGGQLIAFTSLRDGNLEIYVMKTDGSDQTNLTNHPAPDYLPAWSPDGQSLAFVSDRSGKPEIYRHRGFDGSGLIQLTDLPYADGFSWISWSPDGTQLAAEVLLTYEVTGELYGRIFLIQADGSGILDLTRNELPVRTYEPQWSPAGDWIAYVRGGLAPRYLRKVRPDGTRDTRLNLSVRNTRAYAWSPDGSRLAYITSCAYCEVYDDEPADLRLIDLEGSEQEMFYRFEDLSLDFYSLSWSPDGSFLAFAANEGEESVRHIYLMPSGGGELVDMAAFEPGDWFISFLSWSPDGSQLVFDTGWEEQRDIYVIDLEARLQGGVGTGVQNLTPDSPGMDFQPQWQP